jgi:hypothetical protein
LMKDIWRTMRTLGSKLPSESLPRSFPPKLKTSEKRSAQRVVVGKGGRA